MRKTILIFSLLILAIFFLFQISKYAIFVGIVNIEIAVILIAIVFFIIGIVVNKKSLHKKRLPINEIDSQKISELEITKREYQVLQEITLGLSNKEIANKLFLTESTIKTHVSNLLGKLNAKRRTQAIQKAKNLQII